MKCILPLMVLVATLPRDGWAQASSEDFAAYPPGLLAGNGDWSGEEAPGAVQVQPGQLKLDGYRAPSKGRAFLPATKSKVHEAVWKLPTPRQDFFFSFLMRIDKTDELPADRPFGLIRAAKDGASPAAAGVYLQKHPGKGGCHLVASKRANPEKAARHSSELPLGQVVLVVGRYNTSSTPHSFDLWVSPPATSFGGEAPQPDLSLSEGADLSAPVNTILLGGGVGSPGILMDDLRVGDSWGEVTGP